MLLIKFPQLYYQFKDLLAFSVAEFEFDKNRNKPWPKYTKGRLSYHLCVECFSQLSFDSEVYTKSATAADFVYTSELNESCEKHLTERW